MGRFAKILGALSLASFAIGGCLWGAGVFGGNFREVVPGRLYRSAQLSGPNLERALRDHYIASVLNLRGARPGQSFYDSERAICKAEGVAHIDIGMTSRHFPSPEVMEEVLSAFDRLPRPMLIHCDGGSDRSGLVATMFETIEDGTPLDTAEARDLTWRFGHLAFTQSGHLDQFFDLYRTTGGAKPLRKWIEEDYPKLYRRLGDRI